MDKLISELELPGFRFHPTEEELLNFYLKNMVFGKILRGNIIGFLNIYNHHPKELPGLAKIGEREWYFFVPRNTKHGNGGRPNRTTQHGFWKATGSDRKIRSISDPKKMLGLKKTLVFYEGKAPRGKKTDWIMNEYRLPDACSLPPKDIVLCKIYRKATSLKVLEQRALIETDIKNARDSYDSPSSPVITSSSMDSISLWSQLDEVNMTSSESNDLVLFKEENEDKATFVEEKYEGSLKGTCPSFVGPKNGRGDLADLQVPKMNMDWTEDSFWTQLRSPWLDNFTFFLSLC